MSPSQLFGLCNLVVLPAWLLLVLLPAWRWTRILAAYLTPALLALLYILLLIIDLQPLGGGFGSIEQVQRMYQNPWLLLAGWVHLLALDLFIGAWEVRDAQRLEIPHLYVVPSLLLTFVLGPVGLLVYFVVRAAIIRRWPGTDPPERRVQISMREQTRPVGQRPVGPRPAPRA